MFTGVHVMESVLLDCLPAGVSDVIGDAYIPALVAGARIQASAIEGYFAEHSTPERYLEGNLALLRRPGLVPHPPGPLVGVDATASVDPRAELVMPVRVAGGAIIEAGATVGPDVVIGPRARVRSGARVEKSVIWEGAVVEGEVRATVVRA
jgi:NDP-sugar pyrophosphorylase family protein